MYLRISSVLAVTFAAAACGDVSPPPAGDTIACAIGEGAAFAEACTLERVAGTQDIIIHHPDGGFRRLAFDPATGKLAARDGAEPVMLEEGEGVLQFALGPNRYRIPREPAVPPAQ